MTAPTISAFSVTVGSDSVAGTIDDVGKTIAITVPNGTTVSALPTNITAQGATSITAGGAAFTNGGNVNYTSPVTFVVSDGTDSNTYTATVTVSPAPEPTPTPTETDPTMVVKSINMAGWFKVKLVSLKEFAYEAGGFKTPYKSVAVLAINAEGGMEGYVYTDTTDADNPVQKVMLYSAGSEVSGDITADVYLLLE